MDVLGTFFLVLILISIIVFNFLFIKKIKKISKNQLKHILIFFFISIGNLFIGTASCICFQIYILMNRLQLNIDDNSSEARIVLLLSVTLVSCLLNTFILKIYLKKLYKPNEIELIGTE
jgi:hypothetical protein